MMTTLKRRIPVTGSERAELPGARIVGAADPNEQILVTLVVRRRRASKGLRALVEDLGRQLPHERKHLSHEKLAAAHGADPADLEKVEEFAQEHGLDVVEVNAAERRVVLSGTVSSLSSAFGVYLALYEYPGGRYRGRTGHVHVPEDLADIVEGVFGLDDRPQAHPHFRLFSVPGGAVQPRASETSFTPPQVAKLYGFPADATGQGQCIAIIELGGGYRVADLQAYFHRLGIPLPKVKSKAVAGGGNRPSGDPNSADGEVVLDIEVAGAVAPGAKIVVYFAPNTDAGFITAIARAVHDSVNKPSVVSISWGGPESSWTAQAMHAMDQVFQDAAALGVTICCAAGDDGSSDIRPPQPEDGLLHVDFPASSPFALACGGTRLEGSGGTITNEVVWNEGRSGGATGGGVSDTFDLPAWQAHAKVPPSANPGGRVGRGVPDVAGDADPATGYQVLVDSQRFIIGGTSAVAPLYAGLIACLNQKLGHSIGYLNPVLYGLPEGSDAIRDIDSGNNDISGNNGAYHAGTGWDACTGLGTLNGEKLLSALSGQ